MAAQHSPLLKYMMRCTSGQLTLPSMTHRTIDPSMDEVHTLSHGWTVTNFVGSMGQADIDLGLVFAVQVLTLLFGVYDNSKILSHTLHQLACHLCAQEAAREEVDVAWGGRPPNTLQALISLRYLHACLQVRTVHETPMLYLDISLQYHSADFRGFRLHGGTACSHAGMTLPAWWWHTFTCKFGNTPKEKDKAKVFKSS